MQPFHPARALSRSSRWYGRSVPRRYSTVNRQAQSSATFRRILDAVEELLLEYGSEKLTLKDVSERSDVALATVYKHFSSKTELLAAAHRTLAAEIDQFAERVSAAPLGPGGPLPKLRRLVSFIYDDLSEHGDRLARIPTILGVAEIEDAQARARERRRGQLAEILSPAVASRQLILPLNEAVALAFLATSPGLWGDLVTGEGLAEQVAVELICDFLTVNLFETKASKRPAGQGRSATCRPREPQTA